MICPSLILVKFETSCDISLTHLLSEGDRLWRKVNLQSEDGPCSGPLADNVEDLPLHHHLTGFYLWGGDRRGGEGGRW